MTNGDDWGGEGYDAEARAGGGIHFRLRGEERTARLRLVSTALRYTDVFEDKKKGETKQLRRIAWLAILREAVGPNITERVVIFHAGPQVYGAIKELDESDDWGDPQTYDINVTRKGEGLNTEYVVTPCPKPTIGPITKEQKLLVKEAGIDLRAEMDRILANKVLGGTGVQDPKRGQNPNDPDYDAFADD